ncbi:MAG: GNAT family N-acetyltransferase [Nostoc sp.]|uniref:GNAT family N-acetyltransferase n=1 Tax=Nostoc sp. TaxID=1180 RepID=UPI002FFC2FB5
MYALDILQNTTAAKYEKFTFPAFQYVLQNLEIEKSIIAIAASDLDQPLGLVIAEIRQDDQSGEVHSIFVEPTHRSTGIGTALLTRLEAEVVKRGCTKIEMVYTTGKPTTPALERLLQKCNWTSPQTRMLLCKGDAQTIMEAKWMKRYSYLPAGYSIFPWLEITDQERQAIQKQQEVQPWIPKDLIPFQYEKKLEPLNSLGLRYQGQVVGWLINHRLSLDTIRYTCAFVREDLQKMGRVISLFSEAGKRQVQEKIPNVIWTTPIMHKFMVAFIKKHWTPDLNDVDETRGTSKLLK